MFDSLLTFPKDVVGNATLTNADYCIVMFRPTRKVTMQNLFHDGGFSSMGMRAMEQYNKGIVMRK